LQHWPTRSVQQHSDQRPRMRGWEITTFRYSLGSTATPRSVRPEEPEELHRAERITRQCEGLFQGVAGNSACYRPPIRGLQSRSALRNENRRLGGPVYNY